MPKRGRRGLKTSSGLVDPINRHLYYLCHVRIGPISGMVEMQKLSFPFQTNTKDTTITQQKKRDGRRKRIHFKRDLGVDTQIFHFLQPDLVVGSATSHENLDVCLPHLLYVFLLNKLTNGGR